MIVLLKKMRTKTIFSKFEPIKVEALELEYLKSVLEDMDIENYIVDELFSLSEPQNILPDAVVLTGYNVAEKEIIKEAKRYKEDFPDIKVIVGGVHIQLNNREFHNKYIDYICHSQSLNVFRKLIENIRNKDGEILSEGVDSYIYNKKSKQGYWNMGSRHFIIKLEDILADRQIFNQIAYKTRYLEKKRVALIKGSIGCNYNCAYCYCKAINEGHYIEPNYYSIRKEIENIDAKYFWIVDDILFSSRRQALIFIDEFKKLISNKKMIVYLRADFILKNLDLLSKLKEIGIEEVIVGFESTNNEELKSYEKTTDALDYPKVISALKKEEIDLTALFMVNPDYELKDFKKLNLFIKKNKIEVFTISILTPIKGTKTYEMFKNDLNTDNPKKFDFLHLVIPSKLPKWIFYLVFYGLHLRLLGSKRIWKYILRK